MSRILFVLLCGASVEAQAPDWRTLLQGVVVAQFHVCASPLLNERTCRVYLRVSAIDRALTSTVGLAPCLITPANALPTIHKSGSYFWRRCPPVDGRGDHQVLCCPLARAVASLALFVYAMRAGIVTSISVPELSSLHTSSCPPTNWARSRMPGRP
jgi:hypothetical protein